MISLKLKLEHLINVDNLLKDTHHLASTPQPVFALSSLFLGSAFLPTEKFPRLPPFYQRFGFGLIFAGAGYVLNTGDITNGSGIVSAWSLTYLMVNLRKSLVPPRSAGNLLLSAATATTAAIYGTEYFITGPRYIDPDDVS